jgi:NAD(P)-dependent dehydrogenase (short-subunit alcohol dehydrogenase family)
MKIDLSGRLAVVTGSTVGIGFAIARGLAEAGAEVVVNGRKQVPVDLAMAKIQKAAPDAKLRGVAADLSTAEGCAALVKAIPRADILVNNVGIFQLQDFFEIPDGEWSRFLETNVMSGVRLSRAYLKEMMVRNWGRIIFISSESALNIPEDMLHYGVTKTAQLAVARGLAETLAGSGVTVNSVLPGPTASEGVGGFVAELARTRGVDAAVVERDFFATARPSSLLRRFATPDEVAAMIAYVCSERASATTGAALRVDGGVVRSIA